MNNRKPLDPGLASILDSIRESVGGETAPAVSAEEESPPPQAEAPRPRSPGAAAPTPPADGRSVEQFLADLVRPQVQAWLDANLAEIVQRQVAEEVRRLTGE